MSIAILIVPAAVGAATAIATAVAGRKQGNQVVCQVQTRMRDVTLLTAALSDTGATVTSDQDALVAQWPQVRAVLRPDAEGSWSAHVSGAGMDQDSQAAEQRAVDLVAQVDAAYGRRVQAATLERIQSRAGAHGFRLESRTVAEDDAVTLVFEAEEDRA